MDWDGNSSVIGSGMVIRDSEGLYHELEGKQVTLCGPMPELYVLVDWLRVRARLLGQVWAPPGLIVRGRGTEVKLNLPPLDAGPISHDFISERRSTTFRPTVLTQASS